MLSRVLNQSVTKATLACVYCSVTSASNAEVIALLNYGALLIKLEV